MYFLVSNLLKLYLELHFTVYFLYLNLITIKFTIEKFCRHDKINLVGIPKHKWETER